MSHKTLTKTPFSIMVAEAHEELNDPYRSSATLAQYEAWRMRGHEEEEEEQDTTAELSINHARL